MKLLLVAVGIVIVIGVLGLLMVLGIAAMSKATACIQRGDY